MYFGEVKSQRRMNGTNFSMKSKIMSGHSRHWFGRLSMSDHSLKKSLDGFQETQLCTLRCHFSYVKVV